MTDCKVPFLLRDVEFRQRFYLFYVKRRKGFYDVFMGVESKLIGSLTHSYGEWVFCPCVGDGSSCFGSTRSEAVWNWLALYGLTALSRIK